MFVEILFCSSFYHPAKANTREAILCYRKHVARLQTNVMYGIRSWYAPAVCTVDNVRTIPGHWLHRARYGQEEMRRITTHYVEFGVSDGKRKWKPIGRIHGRTFCFASAYEK